MNDSAQFNTILDDISSFARDPVAFVSYAYPWGEVGGPLETSLGDYPWQLDILSLIRDHLTGPTWSQPLLIAVAAGHGIGKSALVGQIIGWAMSTCDDCRVQVCANTGDQLQTKTIPETAKWFSRLINADWWNVGMESIRSRQEHHEKTWRCDFETWSLERTEAIAGLHNKGKRIVRIFDEASAIPDKIWEVAEGALTDENTEIIWLAFGNPTMTTGRFRECFGRQKHRWITRQIDSRTVPGTNLAQFARWVEDFGEDSDFVRVRVRGEFPRAGSKQFIAQDTVYAARKRAVVPVGYKVMAVDVARSGANQTVVLCRQGNSAEVLARWRGLSIADQAGKVALLIMEQSPRCIIIDGDGIGGALADDVRRLLPKPNQPLRDWPQTALTEWYKSHSWFAVQEFHGGQRASDPFMYFNRRAEVWGLMRKWLETGRIPDDPEFEADLTGIEYSTDNPKSVIQLERKEQMAQRGLASPDNGDALAMSFAAFPAGETREEKTLREQAAIQDPMALHFAKLAETERRERARQPKNYWDG